TIDGAGESTHSTVSYVSQYPLPSSTGFLSYSDCGKNTLSERPPQHHGNKRRLRKTDAPMLRETIRRLLRHPILSAMMTVGGFTGLVSLASFGRDLLIANRYGVDRVLDAFLIAYLLPLSLVQVLAASFSSALMPTYVDVRENQSRDASQKLLRN